MSQTEEYFKLSPWQVQIDIRLVKKKTPCGIQQYFVSGKVGHEMIKTGKLPNGKGHK